MRRLGWLSPAVGAGVLACVLAMTLVPGGASAQGPVPADGTRPASIPTEIAGYSYFTGDVSSSPAGRAVAVFQHGFGVEFMDFPQAVVLGADGDVYRRVDVAEDRTSAGDQGDPAPMLLSPDGTRVAVGSHDAPDRDLAVVDLRSGEVLLHPVPGGRTLVPLAWSPDSRRVAYRGVTEPTNPYSGSTTVGVLGLLDVTTGQARILPGAADVHTAAFSPDGAMLAVAHLASHSASHSEATTPSVADAVHVMGLDGAVHRRLPLGSGQTLDGPNAWSPDGSLLAVVNPPTCLDGAGGPDSSQWWRCVERWDGLAFLDASGRGAPVPAPLKTAVAGTRGILGWTAADEVLVLDDVGALDSSEADTGLHWLTALSVNGGEGRRITAVQGADPSYAIGSFQLAGGLLPDLQAREPGPVDRGRWPLGMAVSGAVLAGGAALLATELTLRRRRSSAVAPSTS